MATLKISHGAQGPKYEVLWLLNVRLVQRVHSWIVDPTKDYNTGHEVATEHTDGASPLDALSGEQAQRVLSNAKATRFGTYFTDDPRTEVPFQYLLVWFTDQDQDSPLGVCSERGHTYLMGDDGGTIDRL